jgi:serine/threonine protein kinase
MALLGYVLVVHPENLLIPSGAGRYRLYGVIAAGGMATVHYGRMHGQLGLARTVAIKRLHREYARDPEFVAMFMDEARLAVRVHHPNVVETLDVFAAGGELFLVMEYVPAVSLSLLLNVAKERAEAVPPQVAGAIVADVLRGLHAAHEATDEEGNPLDIVHRDVSPQNILVGADGRARVLDFGIAKASGRQQVTRDGQVKGKFAYMSPEQISNVFVTRQSDVFAASIVLWEVLTGARLFQAESASSVLARVLSAPIEAPSTVAQGLPPALDEIALRGLSRDLSVRYSTGREMVHDLEARGVLATASELSAWVERLAGDELAQRAAHVAEIESASQSERLSLGTILGSAASEREEPVPSNVPRHLRRRRGRRRLALVTGGLLSASALAGVVLADRAAPPRVAELRNVPATLASLPPVPSVQGSSDSDAPVRALKPAASALIQKPPPVDKPVTPRSKAAPSTTARASSSVEPARCDPPYYVDSSGHLIYKSECFR